MKNIFLIITLIIIVASCDNKNDIVKPIPTPGDTVKALCPTPIETAWGEIRRPQLHKEQKLSFDSKKLVYQKWDEPIIRILDLSTLSYQEINLRDLMPSNVYLIGFSNIFWSPYDNERILFHAATSTDSIGDGKRYHYGQNLYIVNINTLELTRVTPSEFGLTGNKGFYIVSWIPQSNQDNDMVIISNRLYNVQEDKFLDINYLGHAVIYVNQNSSYDLSIDQLNSNENIYSVNEYDIGALEPSSKNQFIFSEKIRLSKACWSPDNKYLVFSLLVEDWEEKDYEDLRFFEIWIVDFEKYLLEKPYVLIPDKIINLRHEFCKYAFGGMYTEFITDSTMAVSMYTDGDDFAYIWEVSVTGRIIRQLTFD